MGLYVLYHHKAFAFNGDIKREITYPPSYVVERDRVQNYYNPQVTVYYKDIEQILQVGIFGDDGDEYGLKIKSAAGKIWLIDMPMYEFIHAFDAYTGKPLQRVSHTELYQRQGTIMGQLALGLGQYNTYTRYTIWQKQ